MEAARERNEGLTQPKGALPRGENFGASSLVIEVRRSVMYRAPELFEERGIFHMKKMLASLVASAFLLTGSAMAATAAKPAVKTATHAAVKSVKPAAKKAAVKKAAVKKAVIKKTAAKKAAAKKTVKKAAVKKATKKMARKVASAKKATKKAAKKAIKKTAAKKAAAKKVAVKKATKKAVVKAAKKK